MGKENNQLTGIEAEGKSGSGKRKGNSSEGSPSPESASQRGSGRRGSGSGSGNETEKEPIEFSLVETKPLDDKEAAKRAKRAEQQRLRRQAKKGDQEGSSPVKSKAKADPTQIKILLSTVSMIAATKEGLDHWSLTDAEINQIAQPLANILSKYDAVSSISTEYADHMTLLMALAMIVFPRVMKSLERKKNKKPKEVKVNARVNQSSNIGNEHREQAAGTPEADRGSSRRESSASSANVSPVLLDLLPATSGF